MRYIRTKDGIYDIAKSIFHFFDGGIQIVSYCKQFEENPDSCKFADTVEELCDEFRGIWINYWEREKESEKEDAHEEYHYDKERDVFYDDFEELTREEAIEKFDIFYGAIWTPKGLIYVAKMNDKGELELL